PAAVDDGAFDRLDGYGAVDDVKRAGRLARRRADAAGELGEVVGRLEIGEGALPVAVIDEVVPVGDLVVDRAAGVTIGNAAVHAARRLVAVGLFRQRNDELAVVTDAVGGGRVAPVATVDFEEAGDLAHGRYSAARRSEGSAFSCAFSSASARRYSTGMTLRNFG